MRRKKNVSEISKTVRRKSDFSISEDIVRLALEQLESENSLADDINWISEFKGLSKREAIRKAESAR